MVEDVWTQLHQELESSLEALKNCKAYGLDVINQKVLKFGGVMLELRLLDLVNECWLQVKIPKEWTQSLGFPILKKRDRNKLKSYRRVSYLN